MSEDHRIRPLPRKHTPIDGVCVDCGREVAAADVARVLRVDSQGRGRVPCSPYPPCFRASGGRTAGS